MYYIEYEGKIVLYNESYKKIQDTLICMPQYQGLPILETDRPIKDFQFADTKEYIEAQIQKRKDDFHRDFFETSLGWVRRKVYMKEIDETKDFLSGLLPTIAVALMFGKEANVLVYDEPDFTDEIVDWKKLQKIKPATQQFIMECANQTDTDFTGIIHPLIENQIPQNQNTFEAEENIGNN